MALSKDIEYKSLTIPGAYITVVRPSITGDKQRISFTLQTCISAENREPLSDVHDTAPYDIDGPNDFIQVYEHLKTRPEFADAEDC